MQAFNYLITDKLSDNKNILSLKENKSLSPDNSYILNFHNNQHRQIAITSNKSFSKISIKDEINFYVKDIVTFSSKLNTSFIEYKIEKKGNHNLVKYWLYHTFLPILFTAKNKYYFVHAGAVSIENKPILFVADSFGGKSTITNHFIKKGHTFISDDKVALFSKDNEIYCVSSYPYHRPYRKTEDLGIHITDIMQGEKEIACIFNLIKSESIAEIKIEKLNGIDKFKVLRYSSDIDLPVYKSNRFEFISKVANNIPIYNITIPWDLNRLDEVYEKIKYFLYDKKD